MMKLACLDSLHTPKSPKGDLPLVWEKVPFRGFRGIKHTEVSNKHDDQRL